MLEPQLFCMTTRVSQSSPNNVTFYRCCLSTYKLFSRRIRLILPHSCFLVMACLFFSLCIRNKYVLHMTPAVIFVFSILVLLHRQHMIYRAIAEDSCTPCCLRTALVCFGNEMTEFLFPSRSTKTIQLGSPVSLLVAVCIPSTSPTVTIVFQWLSTGCHVLLVFAWNRITFYKKFRVVGLNCAYIWRKNRCRKAERDIFLLLFTIASLCTSPSMPLSIRKRCFWKRIMVIQKGCYQHTLTVLLALPQFHLRFESVFNCGSCVTSSL